MPGFGEFLHTGRNLLECRYRLKPVHAFVVFLLNRENIEKTIHGFAPALKGIGWAAMVPETLPLPFFRPTAMFSATGFTSFFTSASGTCSKCVLNFCIKNLPCICQHSKARMIRVVSLRKSSTKLAGATRSFNSQLTAFSSAHFSFRFTRP